MGKTVRKHNLPVQIGQRCRELEYGYRGGEKMQGRQVLHLFACLLVLLLLLLFQLLGQEALAVAMQLWSVAVFAEYAGNVFLVDPVIGDRSPLTECRQDGGDKQYV